jgi:hypothetical protein
MKDLRWEGHVTGLYSLNSYKQTYVKKATEYGVELYRVEFLCLLLMWDVVTNSRKMLDF